MIEGNLRPFCDEELERIECQAKEHQAEFESYEEAYRYFYNTAWDSWVASFSHPA